MSPTKAQSILLRLLVLCCLMVIPASVQAGNGTQATFTVNTTTMLNDLHLGDNICADSNGQCGLFAAVQESNYDDDTDIINLPAGVFYIPSRLELVKPVRITGSGSAQTQTVINGFSAGTEPAFRIRANATIENLAIVGFNQAVVINSAESSKTLYLQGVRVENCGNELAEVGPAITNTCASCAIHISESSEIRNNHSDSCGAITNIGTLTISSSTVSANTSSVSYGGAICSSGVGNTLSINNSLIHSNSADNVDNGYGGALFLDDGTFTITSSEFFNNSSGKGGGAINLRGGTLSITLSKVYDNLANYGGGLALSGDSAEIVNSLIMDNQAEGYGGGLYILKGASITNSSVINNTAGTAGGAVAISDEMLTITNSTVSGNKASVDGGGFYLSNTAVIRLANATLTDNTADFDLDDEILGMGGGFYTTGNSKVISRNSVIAGNKDLKVVPFEVVATDCYGKLESDGYNLLGYAGGFCTLSGNLQGMQYGTAGVLLDPKLGPLTLYADNTQYYHPLFWGPAVDAGNPAGCRDFTNVLLTSDQLQENPRPYSGGSATGYTPCCDLGAIESTIARRNLFLPLAIR